MTEFFHSVSILALAWIVINHTLEITRLKNKIDWLMKEFQSLRDGIDARANQYYSAKASQSDSNSPQETQAQTWRLKEEAD